MTAAVAQQQLHANCDTVAVCSDHERFLIGTYSLEEGDQPVRHGSISLFKSDGKTFEQLKTCTAPAGVLDIKFPESSSPGCTDGGEVFAAALADGTVLLGKLTFGNEVNITDNCSGGEETPQDLTLSVSWSPESSKLAASYQSGFVREFSIGQDVLRLENSYPVSNQELWAVYRSGDVIFSGGDDCKLWRTDCKSGQSVTLRRFDMGVTCIADDSLDVNAILVGTYEDQLYQFDLRKMRDPLQQVDIGGGVWRIRRNPDSENILAIAGMYAGAFIIDRNTPEWTIKQRFNGHQSMCYGIDWLNKRTLLSCSFYDNLLAMWDLQE